MRRNVCDRAEAPTFMVMTSVIFFGILMSTIIYSSTASAQQHPGLYDGTRCEDRVSYTPENRLKPWTARCVPIAVDDSHCHETAPPLTDVIDAACTPLFQGNLIPGDDIEIVLKCDIRDACMTYFSENMYEIVLINAEGTIIQNLGIPPALGNVTVLYVGSVGSPMLSIEEGLYDCDNPVTTRFFAWDERVSSYGEVYSTHVAVGRSPFSIDFDTGEITDYFGTWRWDANARQYRNYRPESRLSPATCRRRSDC